MADLRLAAALLLVAALPSAGWAQSSLTMPLAPAAKAASKAYVSYSLSDEQRSLIEAGVRQQLREPGSARFGTMRASLERGGDAIFACGWIDAKNSFGHYTGGKPFSGRMSVNSGSDDVTRFIVFDIGGTAEENALIAQSCEGYRIRFQAALTYALGDSLGTGLDEIVPAGQLSPPSQRRSF